jgi:uncharacterized protein YcbK (DUF882 family)
MTPIIRLALVALMSAAVLPPAGHAAPPRSRACVARDHRVLWLKHLHRRDELRLFPFSAYGLPCRRPWDTLTRFFHSRHGAVRRTVHPRLLRTLAQIQAHFGGRRIEFMSGYRAPAAREPLTSYHQVGRAADVSIAGVENRDLFEYCRELQRSGQPLGCGLYPRSSHVHVDVRSRPTIWVDLSGYGDGASYVRSPASWLDRHPDAGRGRRAPHARPR